MPESLVRVQKLTGKSITFYEADLCSKESLRAVMSKVSSNTGIWLCCTLLSIIFKSAAPH